MGPSHPKLLPRDVTRPGRGLQLVVQLANALGLVAASLAVAWSRVYLGYHTPMQVTAILRPNSFTNPTFDFLPAEAFRRPASSHPSCSRPLARRYLTPLPISLVPWKQVVAGLAAGTVLGAIWSRLLAATSPYFPRIEAWPACLLLQLRDSSHLVDPLAAERTAAAASRSQARKSS